MCCCVKPDLKHATGAGGYDARKAAGCAEAVRAAAQAVAEAASALHLWWQLGWPGRAVVLGRSAV